MIVRPRRSDSKAILKNVGKVIMGLGAAMFIPFALSLGLAEWKPAVDFAIGILSCFAFGAATSILCRTEEHQISWMAGLPTVALSWLTAMVFGAIPLYLSGHFGSFLDACFDCMSGLATTGLTVIHDIDHMAFGTNLWRHLIMFLGGQGIVVVVLTFFVAGSSRAAEMYLGEGREERVFPNVISTARFIWAVSLVYLIIGTFILWVTALWAGMPPAKGLFDSICIFMAGYDTGGFTPHSLGIMFYHSVWFEIATMVTMMLGMVNFGVHHALWSGNRRELYRNVETRTLGVTMLLTVVLTAVGLTRSGVYPGAVGVFRRGLYQIVSGHSGTGFMTIYGRQFTLEWGPIAVLAAIIAMGLGGSSGSTSGGIKALRVNLGVKALWRDVKKLLSPPDTVIAQKYHHIRDVILTDRMVHSVLVITGGYLACYVGGALALTLYDYPLAQALFESTSACANVGITNGITSHAMPAAAKVVFILQMWAGRLEFMSVFLLMGFFYALVRGK